MESVNQRPPYYVHRRRVAYHETDAMGVVHHSNHIKYFEEARVAWLRDRGLMDVHTPYGPLIFAVLRLENRYFKPARFDDELEVWVQSRFEGARIHFRYALWSLRLESVIADGTTVLVPLSADFRPTKIPPRIVDAYATEPWSDVWPPVRPDGSSGPST